MPRFLCLRAKGRPLGIAVVILELVPADGGTTVRMSEWPDGPLAIVALNPVVDVLTRVRNAESLKRLERLVMRRFAGGGGRAAAPGRRRGRSCRDGAAGVRRRAGDVEPADGAR